MQGRKDDARGERMMQGEKGGSKGRTDDARGERRK